MPPRWACLIIAALFLGANGWVFYHDMLPHLLPGQPPPFAIDVLEEVQDRRWMRPVGWTLHRNGNKVMTAKIRVEHVGRDTFEMIAEYQPIAGQPGMAMHQLLVKKMSSTYRVSAAGELLAVGFELEGQPAAPGLRKVVPGDFTLSISGPVVEGRFRPTGRLALAGGAESQMALPGARVRAGGGVLLPLHPVSRLRGLRPGQSWTTAVFDPVADAFRNLGGEGELPRLRCRVRDEEEELTHGRREGVACLVIDQVGDDVTVRTWVARDTELVLAQEVVVGKNDVTAMYRD